MRRGFSLCDRSLASGFLLNYGSFEKLLFRHNFVVETRPKLLLYKTAPR
jgi:hypothetical protein